MTTIAEVKKVAKELGITARWSSEYHEWNIEGAFECDHEAAIGTIRAIASTKKKEVFADKTARKLLCDLYLDRINNYISAPKFAEHHGLTEDQAWALLGIAKGVYESKHPEA
ncbi:MAG: hypothetical protein ACXWYM_00425 [Candidatus Binatia bacterium]